MLDWFTSSHRAGAGNDLSGDEPPDTPAHLFAVKAFKTAMWGTPAPYVERSVLAGKKDVQANPIGSVVGHEADDGDEEHEGQDRKEESKPRHSNPFASPTKGILLTPRVGGSTAKRKSVSFGRMVEGMGKAQNDPQNSVDQQQQDQGAQRSKEEVEKAAREDLRRTLFQAKVEASQKRTEDINGVITKTSQQNSAQEHKSNTGAVEIALFKSSVGTSNTQSPDVTVDLQAPRSRSGKHWKHEYERDHDASKAEMKKLIQYSQIAKSFAEKRDGDASRLTEKWKKAEAKVKEMESQVSALAAQLMGAHIQDEKQIDLVNEVASQTTRALRYKQKADRYRLALGNEKAVVESTDEELERRVGRMNDGEGRIAASGSEVSRLQKAARKAEARAEDVERENKELKKTLARVKDEMVKFEARNKEREERRKNKDEKAATEKRRLEEDLLHADGQRKELVNSLDQANERVKSLQHELDVARFAANTDPAIDHIQLMRRRLRGLERRDSRESTMTQTQELAESPGPKERFQARSALNLPTTTTDKTSSPKPKDHSHIDPISPPDHSAKRRGQSPDLRRLSRTGKTDILILSDEEKTSSSPLPGAEKQQQQYQQQQKKSHPNSSSLLSTEDVWTTAAATIPTSASSSHADQRRPSLIPSSRSADSHSHSHRALSPRPNDLLPARHSSTSDRWLKPHQPQSQAISKANADADADAHFGGPKRVVSPLVPSTSLSSSSVLRGKERKRGESARHSDRAAAASASAGFLGAQVEKQSAVGGANRGNVDVNADVDMDADAGVGLGREKVEKAEKAEKKTRKSELPPERAEAARKRLEAKMRERMRGRRKSGADDDGKGMGDTGGSGNGNGAGAGGADGESGKENERPGV